DRLRPPSLAVYMRRALPRTHGQSAWMRSSRVARVQRCLPRQGEPGGTDVERLEAGDSVGEGAVDQIQRGRVERWLGRLGKAVGAVGEPRQRAGGQARP